MHADFSVELGREDPALELPWSSADPYVRYYDLKNHPELVQQIPEVLAHPELGSFLAQINTAGFPLATAKCDAWSSREVAPEEEIFGDRKFVSYIDLVFVNEADRCSFEKHEAFAKELCRLLGHAPEIAATVEVVIRRCYYHQEKGVFENEIVQSETPIQQSVNCRTAALQTSAFVYEDGEHFNTNEPPHSRANELETPASSNYLHPYEGAQLEAQFHSEEEFPSEGKVRSDDKVRSESKAQSGGKVRLEDKVSSEDTVRSEDKVWAEGKVQSEEKVQLDEKVQSGNRPRWEDALASTAGFCLTAYVTGFGDSDHDPVRRWAIGLSLLQHALVQLTLNR
ncbi:MAG: hypothetical protein ACXVKL_10620 [Candidatus Angelobacter sp.]